MFITSLISFFGGASSSDVTAPACDNIHSSSVSGIISLNSNSFIFNKIFFCVCLLFKFIVIFISVYVCVCVYIYICVCVCVKK